MIRVKRRFVCCTRDREISIDFDEQERIVTYNGLESCIMNNQTYEYESGTSRADGCATDSFNDDASSCSSSNAFGSFSSKWLQTKRDEQFSGEWEPSESPHQFYVKEKPAYPIQSSDAEGMKEKFSKLLLGEDITGGRKGISTALALSNAITNLAASVFGELWKLEPLADERKEKWHREMDWLLSPTNYMVELVPAKQCGANGKSMEIMTPKVRNDIHMNLPALQKLDCMLIETLDSMVNTEFSYAEVGSRAGGRIRGSERESKRWWLPLPQIPKIGLSDVERKKLLSQGRMVHQVFKAAKAINENVLLEMPVPIIIKEALPKSGKANLSDELYKVLAGESCSNEEMINSLVLRSEHAALDTINRLEAAILAWKERKTEQVSGKSPVRTSWSLKKDSISEFNRVELLLSRAEGLLQEIRTRNPSLPHSFLDATKIQYGKDVGHSILEAYSRVIGNLAFSILTRIAEILHEDSLSNPNSPAVTCCFPGTNINSPVLGLRVRHSLIEEMNKTDEKHYEYDYKGSSDVDSDKPKYVKGTTPSMRRVWCLSKGVSPRNYH